MRTELADDLFTVAGVLTAAECRALIDRGEGIGFQRAAVRTGLGAVLRPDLRDNDRAGFADPGLADDLWARCPPAVPAELEGADPSASTPTSGSTATTSPRASAGTATAWSSGRRRSGPA